MDENENTTSGLVPRLVGELMGQLRAATGRLEDLTRFSGGLPPAPGSLPLPGGLSATQMASITDSIAAQRRSIAALQAQVSSFDEQLEVLEQILGPLAQWSRSWADLEQRLRTWAAAPGPRVRPATSELTSSSRPMRSGPQSCCLPPRPWADYDPRRVTSFGRQS